jgi:hypothetical protein
MAKRKAEVTGPDGLVRPQSEQLLELFRYVQASSGGPGESLRFLRSISDSWLDEAVLSFDEYLNGGAGSGRAGLVVVTAMAAKAWEIGGRTVEGTIEEIDLIVKTWGVAISLEIQRRAGLVEILEFPNSVFGDGPIKMRLTDAGAAFAEQVERSQP